MDFLRDFITANPILAASLSSLWGAIVIDLMAFSKTKEPGPFLSQFGLKVAALRYLQALVAGFVGNMMIAGAAGAVVGLLIWGF